MSSCGTKTRLPGRRQSLGADATRRENFRQVGIQRFSSQHSQAADHSAGRNQAVAELLCHLSFLRTLGDIRADDPVNWDRAHLQVRRGTTAENAAHRLPCQIVIRGVFPWDLVRSPLIDIPRMQLRLRELFADVWQYPKAFNLADCEAEENCLRGALTDACQSVISETRPLVRRGGVLKHGPGNLILVKVEQRPGSESAGIDRNAVRMAWEVWRRLARKAFDRALAGVQAGGVTYAGSDFTEEVAYILARYRESLSREPPRLSDHMMHEMENDLWI